MEENKPGWVYGKMANMIVTVQPQAKNELGACKSSGMYDKRMICSKIGFLRDQVSLLPRNRFRWVSEKDDDGMLHRSEIGLVERQKLLAAGEDGKLCFDFMHGLMVDANGQITHMMSEPYPYKRTHGPV